MGNSLLRTRLRARATPFVFPPQMPYTQRGWGGKAAKGFSGAACGMRSSNEAGATSS
jgi:hypothetical protein